MGTDEEVIVEVREGLGHLVLNRPRAINALTAGMVAIMRRALAGWAASDTVRAVLITGAGERGLCAGGDIRAIHADAVSGGSGSIRFWADEYELNATIAEYPKPVVALMDGLVMGGGIGVSAHASVRVVTERSRLAMPEVGIGMHPDVGGSWLLSRAPGELGTHLALTGSAVGAADGIAAGLADFFVPSERLPALVAALEQGQGVRAFTAEPPPGEFATAREWIDVCYRGDSVIEIVDRLARHPAPGAQAAAKEIGTRSPTALTITLRSLRTAARLPDLRAALGQELRLSAAMLRLPDLAEGIRAQIIDKDRNPRWRPSSLAEVRPETVDEVFEATR
ncbi:3-hydroxyisobutyryl-CoA hydrolase [Actinoplanes sp. SE50]|uniref:enoyl-CoA hydratase/isomerase family protein n=1 Tax=unclassified Actinoplanes TaxID=2626549 RepID=UPI00023EC9B0|nr:MULTISPECIES: enoyl-CoA hydratase/isomerase family protein [unclassified Actinoplanes]AEV85394.1 enoyl-CoA hydratase [Actinoplanes sp. SE50/110]ATO83789.1 3-hydroxyisobutyryl-CoA hydrolase [Actinoplanes sp. SE50]SLM01197.1 3-hydroxyisobutyryl-CoA hydrolase [Actinoplanes sp. SE50/110]